VAVGGGVVAEGGGALAGGIFYGKGGDVGLTVYVGAQEGRG
jgi:hypothetical protein